LVEKWFDKLGDRVVEEGARVRAVIESGLTATNTANRLRGARAIPIDGRALAVGWGAQGTLMGWSLRNTGASNVTVNFRDGRSTDGDLIGTVILGQNSAWMIQTAWFGPGGVSFGEALFIEVTGGTIAGSAYIRAHD
jgi:hypothetical protein